MFKPILKKIAIEFKKRKIPYMVIGGQAVLLYGEPRFTRDIDITLGVDVDALEKIKAAAGNMGFKPAAGNPEKLAAETNVFPVEDKKSGIRVDFIFSYSEYERIAMKKTRKVDILGIKVNFMSAEDLVIHKLIAGRPKDIEDAENVLIKNKRLDKKYIRKWLKSFGESIPADYIALFEKIIKRK